MPKPDKASLHVNINHAFQAAIDDQFMKMVDGILGQNPEVKDLFIRRLLTCIAAYKLAEDVVDSLVLKE
jgi:hypothetical protein